jgi:hypothetical protein
MFMKISIRENIVVECEDEATRRNKELIMMS